MNPSKHSPGPWRLEYDPKYSTIVVLKDANGNEIEAPFTINRDLEMANGVLMAAAPDLFEAVSRVLKELAEWDGEISIGSVEDMQAAISKATGGEK